MRAAPADLAALRRKLAVRTGFTPGVSAFTLGSPALDAALPSGLPRGALHEVFAARTTDEPSAAAFALALSLRAAGKGKAIVWVRQDFARIETGALYAPGIAELGLDPSRIVLVRAHDAAAVLRAAEESARCSPLGAVLFEPWGDPKALDLTASRRLALAAGHSGVPLLMIRAGADPSPSAATTRWEVRAAPSAPLEADAPGHPAFDLKLLRSRNGLAGGAWRVEWNRDACAFSDAPASGRLAALPVDRPSAAPAEGRLAG